MEIKMNVSGKTVCLGVVGCPVEHSISPQLHNTMAKIMKKDVIYAAYRVEKGEMQNAINAMRTLSIRGLNVTIPHKEDAARFCDRIDPFAQKMGACNTLVNEGGVIKGYNTDGIGFIRSLERKDVFVQEKRVAIIGAGGAASGVAMALAEYGAKKIMIMNRTREKADLLCEKINNYYPQRAESISEIENCDILINATNVGMNSAESPFDDFGKLKDTVVCDIVYCPRETVFLKKARAAGLLTVGGIGMLIEQAASAFELFTGDKVNIETIKHLYKMTELERSIVLTGFMGTGKSTVGKALCSLTGAQFIDTDDLIEKETGMKISEIFKIYGEEHFRDIESSVIKSLSGMKGAVISLGGGAVIRRENIDLMRERGFVVCLKADIERVYKNIGGDGDTRPLLSGKTMEEAAALLKSREEFYKNCDFALDVTELEKDESAALILEKYMQNV